MRAFPLSIAGALTVVLAAGVVKADETPDPVRAAALFAEGRRLMATEDYAAACPKLAESQALDPAPDTALDLGICYQKASQAAFKVAHTLAQAPEGDATPSVPSLALAPEPEALPPGQTQRVVGLTIGGAGVAGLLVGAITGVMAKSAYDNAVSACAPLFFCSASQIRSANSARDLASASTVSLVAGAAALGTGALVFFTSPRARTSSGRSVGLGPAAEGAGLSVAGHF